MAKPNSARHGNARRSKGMTCQEFHEALHDDLGKPLNRDNGRDRLSKGRGYRPYTGDAKPRKEAHAWSWADAKVHLRPGGGFIDIHVRLRYQPSGMSKSEAERLKRLANKGIGKYWSRGINLAGQRFRVRVVARHHQTSRSIPVDIMTHPGPEYGRSSNVGMLGIDANFVYNPEDGKKIADLDFQLVAAHEFGHAVLMGSEGAWTSWTHKGSSYVVPQLPRASTPGYPDNGKVDLMRYYDREENAISLPDRARRTKASEKDVKRLIWGGASRMRSLNISLFLISLIGILVCVACTPTSRQAVYFENEASRQVTVLARLEGENGWQTLEEAVEPGGWTGWQYEAWPESKGELDPALKAVRLVGANGCEIELDRQELESRVQGEGASKTLVLTDEMVSC